MKWRRTTSLTKTNRSKVGYRPISASQVLWNGILATVSLGTALTTMVLGTSETETIVVTIAVGAAVASLLAISASRWGAVAAAALLFAGPPLIAYFMPGATIVWGPWFFSMLGGWFIGSTIRAPNAKTVRAREMTTSRVQWFIGGKAFVEEEPTVDQAINKIKALNGEARTHVVLRHAGSRLDICGSAGGAMAVFHSPDTLDDEAWSMATSPESTSDEVKVVMRDAVCFVEKRRTVCVEDAVKAAQYFLAAGKKNPALTWWTGSGVLSVKPPLGE